VTVLQSYFSLFFGFSIEHRKLHFRFEGTEFFYFQQKKEMMCNFIYTQRFIGEKKRRRRYCCSVAVISIKLR
jgi:hypothetical protein